VRENHRQSGERNEQRDPPHGQWVVRNRGERGRIDLFVKQHRQAANQEKESKQPAKE
jgi:hypothetical protein